MPAQRSFMGSKKVTEFSDILFSHLERLSNQSINLSINREEQAIYNFELGINHLASLLSPYIKLNSDYVKQDDKLKQELEEKQVYPSLVDVLQIEYIALLQKRFSLLITIMYQNNLLETKKDSFMDEYEDEEK